jgi:nickel transport protein
MIKPNAVKILLVIGFLILAVPAAAHKVSVFGYVEGGQILGEGYFSGGGKARQCQVSLLDSSGKILAQTKTDDQGAFRLKLPQAAPPLRLVLDAGMGHRGEYLLTAKDLGKAIEATKNAKAPQAALSAAPSEEKAPALATGIDAQQLSSIVEKALAKQLAPLTAQIAKMNAERGIGISDVIGGLGYILGLLGLAAYMKSRKQK